MKQNRYLINNLVESPYSYWLYVSYSYRTKQVLVFYKNGDVKPATKDITLQLCEKFLKAGLWKEISYKQTVELRNQFANINADTFAIQCFLNGQRKFTDKLTQNQAYNFRKAAEHLYRYLTKEYKLEKFKNG